MRRLLALPLLLILVGAADLPEAGPVPEPAPRETDENAATPEERPEPPGMDENDEDAADEQSGDAEAGEPEAEPDPPPPLPDEAALAECENRLRALGAQFERRPAIDGPGKCGLPATYAVTKIARGVSVAPETEMTCRTALATARWVRNVVIPAARVLGEDTKLTGIRHASTYVCRPRNSQDDAKLSEHALGGAIDIAGFEFDGHRPLPIVPEPRRGSVQKAFQKAVRAGACLHFTTVLGPGADAYHDDHIHLDTIRRGGGFRLCQ